MASLPPVHIEKNLFLQMSEKNLARLRNPSSFGNTNSEKKIEDVSRDFESIFLHKLLTSMRTTVPKSGLLDSFATDMYKSMMDEIINKIDEDAPTNAVGDGGNVALPPKHEPGVDKKKKKDPILGTLKRKVQESNDLSLIHI